jgi:tetratricopeptide (TPR) repeat protein
VVLVSPETELKLGPKVVATGSPHRLYRVERVVGGALLLVSGDVKGWVDQDEVITWDEAMADYDRRIANDPHGAPWAYFQRGNLWLDKREWARAAADYSAVLHQLPKDQNAYHNRGLAWLQLKQYQWALSDLSAALQLDPNDLWLYVDRGLAWTEIGSFDRALADYSAALQLKPDEPKALEGRGLASLRLGQVDLAIADLTEALRLNPRLARAYTLRATARKAKGDYQHALDDLAEAVRLVPADADAYSVLAAIWATCPDPRYRDGQRAYEAARRAYDLHDQPCAACLDTLAAAYAEAGDFTAAVKWQNKAIAAVGEGADEAKPLADRLALYRAGTPYHEPSGEARAIAAAPGGRDGL